MAIAVQSALNRLRAAITPSVLGAAAILMLAFLAAFGSISLAGSKRGLVLSLMGVLGPIAIYAALSAPLIFPFCLFVILVPFDNLLVLSTFGTLTKLVAAMSGAAIVFWLLYRQRFVVPDKPLLMWGLFFAWILASLTWAIDPAMAYQHVMTLTMLYLLYVAISFSPVTPPTLRAVLISICIGAMLAGAYGAYLFHHGVDVTKDGRLVMQDGDNNIDPNQFAAALIMPFALSLSFAVNARSWPLRIFAYVALLFIATGLALCGSRGGLLGAIFAFVVLTLRSERHRAILGFVGIAGLGTVLALYGNVLARFHTAAQTGGAGRTSIWGVGFAAFKHNPIFGYGFSNFSLAYDRYYLLVPEHYLTNWSRAPHDLILQTSTELGLIGLVLLGIAFYAQIRTLHVIRPGHPLHPIRTALEASYAGILIASIFLDMLTFKYFWLLLIATTLVRNAAVTQLQGARIRERAVPAVLQTIRNRG